MEPKRAVRSGARRIAEGTAIGATIAARALALLIAANVTACSASDEDVAAYEPTSDSLIVDLEDDSVQPPAPDGKHTLRGQFKEDPVVFVHGCPLPKELGGSVTNARTASLWWKMHNAFVAAGYPGVGGVEGRTWDPVDSDDEDAIAEDYIPNMPRDAVSGQYLNVFVYDGPNCGSNVGFVEQLDRFVDQVRAATGSARVDLVANSMGAIPARLVVLRSGGKRIRDVVILAGPNHGTDVALLADEHNPMTASPHYDGARELRPAYACKGMQLELNGCLPPLGDGGVDETPYDSDAGGALAYLNIYNAVFDELVEPTFSACLNQRSVGDCSDPVNDAIQIVLSDADEDPQDTPHGGIRFDDGVIRKTLVFVRARNKVQRTP